MAGTSVKGLQSAVFAQKSGRKGDGWYIIDVPLYTYILDKNIQNVTKLV